MNKGKYIIALDQGTTSSRAIIFDKLGKPICVAQKEYKQYYPKPGWVEHDPRDIWQSQALVAEEVLIKKGLHYHDIHSVGITNQRETTILWDRNTGEPIYNAIVWQDRRTANDCKRLKEQGNEQLVKEKTGLVIDPYFSATKIKWILDHVDGARGKAQRGDLCFGTVDTWLLWNLTEGKIHATEVSNASRTMLFNIHTLQWDQELLDLFDIPKNILPKVKSSSEVYGYTTTAKIPITGMAGDQQAALFGQMCTKSGMVKNTYGTGCFMVMNTGQRAIESNNNLITTVAWQIEDQVNYALEGSIFIGGAVVQWLRDELKFFNDASESELLANSVADNGGVYFVPALTGLGAPHWDPYARGTITGITRGTNRAHITRAALESIAFQVLDVLKAMEDDKGKKGLELRIDGGAVVNNLLMQFQADMAQIEVVRPKVLETTALGAAYLSGLASNYWGGIDELEKLWEVDRVFKAEMAQEKVDEHLFNWNKVVRMAKTWGEQMD